MVPCVLAARTDLVPVLRGLRRTLSTCRQQMIFWCGASGCLPRVVSGPAGANGDWSADQRLLTTRICWPDAKTVTQYIVSSRRVVKLHVHESYGTAALIDDDDPDPTARLPVSVVSLLLYSLPQDDPDRTDRLPALDEADMMAEQDAMLRRRA